MYHCIIDILSSCVSEKGVSLKKSTSCMNEYYSVKATFDVFQ